ncbi:MAG: hypothetical protein ACI8TP_003045 [Acidimicrobiales bacterium]
MEPLELVQKYYDQTDAPSRDFEDNWIEPDFKMADAPLGLWFEGREQHWAFAQAVAAANPDPESGQTAASGQTVQCHEYLGSPDRGVIRWTWTARGATVPRIFGLAPVPGEFKVQGLGLVTFRNGRLATLEEFWDSADLRRRLGADIPQPKIPSA